MRRCDACEVTIEGAWPRCPLCAREVAVERCATSSRNACTSSAAPNALANEAAAENAHSLRGHPVPSANNTVVSEGMRVLGANYTGGMARLLVVHHSPTPSVRGIADAALAGTHLDGIEGVEVIERAALEATIDDVLEADGYLLGTTANFGYISGALKHFFDTTFNRAHEVTAKRPFSYWIHGGYDTTGAENAMNAITTGYGWALAAPPLVFTGEVTDAHLEQAAELGATIAATLME